MNSGKTNVVLLVVAAMLAVSARAEPLPYQITTLSLIDAEHTRDDGYRDSYTYELNLNEAGQVAGSSERYNGGSTGLGNTAWLYDGSDTLNIGLTDAEHTRDDGYRVSFTRQLNEAGQVAGYSERYNGGSTSLGETAWLYDGSDTLNIGLTDAEHTRNDGYRYNGPLELNEAGQVAGYCFRYNGGSTSLGATAWLYGGSGTLNIGLTDAEHTRNDDYRYNIALEVNEAGQVAGYCERYNGGSTKLGRTVWLYDGSGTLNIGLTDPEHSRNDGYRYNDTKLLNEAGQVAGYSYRYNGGSTSLGRTAWLYDGSGTLNIGLTDAEHTRNDGYRFSDTRLLNEAGQVAGLSTRYNGGSTSLGETVWLYDGTDTLNIGLTDAEHTRNDGYRYSYTQQLNLNEAGQVAGASSRYNGGSTSLGATAWLYDGADTLNIGLTDAEHTRNDGYRYNRAWELNEAGQVAGYCERYNGGSTYLGYTAWLYDGTDTLNIGLTDTEHTRDDGYRYSYTQKLNLNEAGQVAGLSTRYNGGSTELGRTAWLYDPTLDETFAFVLSTRSDGYACSWAEYLGEDGLVLGYYRLFDDADTYVGDRAFCFTAEDGLDDLGSLVDGGLDGAGWEHLAHAIRANGAGQILGWGLLDAMPDGSVAYLLTPVPEPSTLLLLSVGATGLLVYAWRKRCGR